MLADKLLQVPLQDAAAICCVLFCLSVLATWWSERRKIQALGGHASRVRNYLPMGLDLTYAAVKGQLYYRSLEWWNDLLKDHHTVEATLSAERMIFTDDPENIKAVLAGQFRDFGKGEPFHRDWSDFLGDSIFTTDLEQWHDSRQLIRPQFIKDRVSDLETFERHVSKLLDKIGGNGEPVDIQSLLFRYTLDAITDFLLGESVNSLDNPQLEFAEAFQQVQQLQSIIAKAGKLSRFVPRRKFHKNLKIINEFVQPYIENALRLSPTELEEKTKSDSDYTFLHALAGFTRDRKVVRDQLVAVLLAGRVCPFPITPLSPNSPQQDTTAASLSWLFHELSHNPTIVARLRAEILSTVGPSTVPTYSALKSMKYLQHTLSETLRLYPGVPFNLRLALHDTSLPRGGGPLGTLPVGCPKDTPIAYSTLKLHRRADLYPAPSPAFPPVHLFAPDRWDHWTPRSWQYIPFNGGPRICIGQQFALAEMAYTVVRVLQRFDRVESRPRLGREAVEMRAEIVLQPAGEVRVGFWEAEGEKGEG
ncbi:MAG: hypothetical protein M1833_003485 [Piccolia ochrophora]|nr:MAG: hypothetical protein M1833_003485 [Piccolia ochrophora]